MSFTITVDDVRRVWSRQCPVLGIHLRPGKGKVHDASPSLDRLNGAWGYEPGNIAVISYRANRAKGPLSAEEHERIAAWMRGNGLG